MEFADTILIRLADPSRRAQLFDDEALEHVVTAAYDLEPTDLEGPFSATFDDLRIGFPVTTSLQIEGTARIAATASVIDVALRVPGLDIPAAHVAALWRGTITTRAQTFAAPVTTVTTVEPGWPALEALDAAIAKTGALPTEPAALEEKRRTALLAHLATALPNSAAFSQQRLHQAINNWLNFAGTDTVAELLNRRDIAELAATITFGDTVPVPPSTKTLPVSVAVLVRQGDLALTDLLVQSNRLARQLIDLGSSRPAHPDVPVRSPVVVAWVLPESVFDDTDWPGGVAADPATASRERRTTASRWLAREGIVLITVPTSA